MARGTWTSVETPETARAPTEAATVSRIARSRRSTVGAVEAGTGRGWRGASRETTLRLGVHFRLAREPARPGIGAMGVTLALSTLCENPGRRTGLSTFFPEFVGA